MVISQNWVDITKFKSVAAKNYVDNGQTTASQLFQKLKLLFIQQQRNLVKICSTLTVESLKNVRKS